MNASSARREERVRLPGAPTRVRLGSGARDELVATLAEVAPHAQRGAWLVDAEVERLWERTAAHAPPAGLNWLRVTLPAGEAAKERPTLERLLDVLLDLRREEPVVAVGGGATLDVGGLAAALAHRGHPWIAIPTTVVAMADAAVGGKVAINHARGKNLIGTFHPPRVVLADLDFLSTLPAREANAGWAEVWKSGVVGDGALLEVVERGSPVGRERLDALARALAVKARLVERDERDVGARRGLNYGHTVGHALERLGLNLLHGEAVAIGMCVAARLALARGRVRGAFLERQRAALLALDLPVEVPPTVDRAALLARIGVDKKRRAGALHTFVLPVSSAGEDVGVEIAEDVGADEVEAALAPTS